ncbi:MAG: hypothetical protein ACE5OQ_10055 [Woeseia sp.]
MKILNRAIRRQQAVQRSRTIAWALFAVFVAVSLLFVVEVIFGFLHMDEVGVLQLLAELILALLFAFAAAKMFRAGLRFNRLLADPDSLMHNNPDLLKSSFWSAFFPSSFRSG